LGHWSTKKSHKFSKNIEKASKGELYKKVTILHHGAENHTFFDSLCMCLVTKKNSKRFVYIISFLETDAVRLFENRQKDSFIDR